MSQDNLKLWELTAVTMGDQPSPPEHWRLVNGFKSHDEEDIYERSFTIVAATSEEAKLWVEALLSDTPGVTYRPPVQKKLDVIIHEVTNLLPLLERTLT